MEQRGGIPSTDLSQFRDFDTYLGLYFILRTESRGAKRLPLHHVLLVTHLKHNPPESHMAMSRRSPKPSLVLSLFISATIFTTVFIITLQHGKLLGQESTSWRDGSSLAPGVNSTLGFDKIFVLNLPSRTDRRDAMDLMASITGIDVEFEAGVKGEDVSKITWPKVSWKRRKN